MFRGCESIPGNTRIYQRAPEIDPASHALAVFNSLPAQPVGYRQAANAVMAENDDPRSVIIQFTQVLRNGLHGNQRRAFDVANGVLCRFPNIYQTKRGSFFHELIDFRRGYLNWQCIHRPRV